MAFRFPPPPPPPPKATSNEQPFASQQGGQNRGGSDRGRGRGGNQNRGGSFHSSAGNLRGGHGQNRGRGDTRGRGQRGGYQNNRGGGNTRGGFSAGNANNRTNAPADVASQQGHANPSFSGNATTQTQTQQQVDPNAFAQVMSYMSTPAGVQSMAAFANHMTSTGNAAAPYPPSSPSAHSPSGPRYSPPQHAGQKRKLNERNNNAQSQRNQPQQGSKPPRAKAAVPPQVPSFGFSLPPPSVVKPDNKKRKVNLGLSQQPTQHDSSDEEDIDEEAAYSEKLKGGGFAFEHEGETITIQTGAEVAAWIKDRRKNFPTQERITEKEAEAAKKRMAELDFLRRMQGKPPKEPASDAPTQPKKARQDSKIDVAKQEAEQKKQEELAALRQKLHASMVKKQSTPAVVDLGLGYDSETESEEQSSVVSESSVVSSSEESEPESDSDDSDDAPEPVSSKAAPPTIKVPPPPLAKSQTESKSTRMCSNWKRNGKCPYYSKCKYQHPPKEDDTKLTSLYERMVEQELVKADQLALDAIKYLGQNGFLG